MTADSGLLYGMGSNQYGKLGLPIDDHTPSSYAMPKLIDQLLQHKIGKITCGLNHALAITQDTGVVYSWGCGLLGQLGRPVTQNQSLPAAVMSFIVTGTKIVDVSAGGKHSLYLSEGGQVFSSGSNDYGQLGYETSDQN